jgi:hypothetical protein
MVAKPDGRIHPRAEQGGPHALHARGVCANPAAQRRLQRALWLSLHPGRARAARHGAVQARDHRHLRAPPGQPPRLRARRVPAQHPPHRRDPAERQVWRRATARQRWCGTGTNALAQHSDPGYAEKGQLTVTYLTDAHRACAQRISQCNMRDAASTRFRWTPWATWWAATTPARRRPAPLLTGSHYDTVRNGGKYDGRLGIFVPMACVQRAGTARAAPALRHRGGRPSPKKKASATRPPFWARARSSAHFHPEWLDQKDADGVTMREAMQHAGLCVDDIPRLRRNPADYLGFVEVHIEQGPVLNETRPAAGHRHLDQWQRALPV